MWFLITIADWKMFEKKSARDEGEEYGGVGGEGGWLFRNREYKNGNIFCCFTIYFTVHKFCNLSHLSKGKEGVCYIYLAGCQFSPLLV